MHNPKRLILAAQAVLDDSGFNPHVNKTISPNTDQLSVNAGLLVALYQAVKAAKFTSDKHNRFKIDINLDDENDLTYFLELSERNGSGRKLADALGIIGQPNAQKAAKALRIYAETKETAIKERKDGDLGHALEAEEKCDLWYKEITKLIDCW